MASSVLYLRTTFKNFHLYFVLSYLYLGENYYSFYMYYSKVILKFNLSNIAEEHHNNLSFTKFEASETAITTVRDHKDIDRQIMLHKPITQKRVFHDKHRIYTHVNVVEFFMIQ